ncbi:hypothetical protein WN48_04648 [Eufriesea mexicana]|uniref:Uncharacterized protein n=1 Tax=Eufriesea mexicana TaxID=516756 RepID=A0A310SE69_9HYME|nr:hypothetical protein WN48_04648 [Eufriesea mexicana]
MHKEEKAIDNFKTELIAKEARGEAGLSPSNLKRSDVSSTIPLDILHVHVEKTTKQQKQSGITHRLRCYNGGRCVYQSRMQELVQTESNYIGLYDTVTTSTEWKDLIEQYWITQEYSCMSGLEKKL